MKQKKAIRERAAKNMQRSCDVKNVDEPEDNKGKIMTTTKTKTNGTEITLHLLTRIFQ
jgi:hypothetical protein